MNVSMTNGAMLMGDRVDRIGRRAQRIGDGAQRLTRWLADGLFGTMRRGDPLDRLAVAIVERVLGPMPPRAGDETNERGNTDGE
jgi:hypothetical protein